MAYTVPTPEELKAYYPAFTSVPDNTVQIYIDRVNGSDVDETWFESDFAPAIMAAAAHRMARNSIPADTAAGAVSGMSAAGVTSFRSGSFAADFSDKAVEVSIAGGWQSTPYGQDYYDLLRKNKAGARVTAPGSAPLCGGFNGFAGPLPPWVCQ